MSRPNQCLAQCLCRERAERYERNETDTEAVGSHLVDRVLDRAVDRSHGHDQELRVVGAIGAEQPTRLPPETCLEFGGELGKQAQRQVLLEILQETHLCECFWPD